METSFTSLQSPLQPPSNASSVTNGYFSTSSHVSVNAPHTPLPSNILTFLSRRPKSQQDNRCTPKHFSELKRANSDAIQTQQRKQVDLIHDDWLGLAPLASPESLSEVSSISSRTSFILRTPKMMRRTPKIDQNLSTCADDIRSVRYFQKLRAQIAGKPANNTENLSSNSSNLSYESALGGNIQISVDNILEETIQDVIINTSGESCGESDFQSAENILDSVMQTAGVAEFFNSNAKLFLETHFDENMFESPKKLASDDPDILSNFAIDLQLDQQNRSTALSVSNTNSVSLDSGSVYCKTPSSDRNVHFNPQVINIEDAGQAPPSVPKTVGGGLFNLRRKRLSADATPLTVHMSSQPPKTILCQGKRRNSDEEQCFARTEALPLLSGLGGNGGGSAGGNGSPNYVRRKRNVYPMGEVLVHRGESSV